MARSVAEVVYWMTPWRATAARISVTTPPEEYVLVPPPLIISVENSADAFL